MGFVIALIRKQVNLGHYFNSYFVVSPDVVQWPVFGKLVSSSVKIGNIFYLLPVDRWLKHGRN